MPIDQLTELEQDFCQVYNKFKLHFYQKVFSQLQERETSLTTVETFCTEVIHVLQNPTINEFATFVNISPPNAAYKVNCLIKKGYLTKERSQDDKREYHLSLTDKYYKYYDLGLAYQRLVMERIRERFTPEQLAALAEAMQIINRELMPEVELKEMAYADKR